MHPLPVLAFLRRPRSEVFLRANAPALTQPSARRSSLPRAKSRKSCAGKQAEEGAGSGCRSVATVCHRARLLNHTEDGARWRGRLRRLGRQAACAPRHQMFPNGPHRESRSTMRLVSSVPGSTLEAGITFGPLVASVPYDIGSTGATSMQPATPALRKPLTGTTKGQVPSPRAS